MITLGYATGLGDVTTVQQLQKTLQALGKNVYTAGQVDGYTLAALYEIVRDNLPRLPLMPGVVKDAVGVLKDLDGVIRTVTLGNLSTGNLLINSDTVVSTLRRLSDTAANSAQKAVDAFKSAVNNNALPINTALSILLVPAAGLPPPPPPAPTPNPQPGKPKTPFTPDFSQLFPVADGTGAGMASGSTIHAFDPALNLYRVAKPLGLSGFGAVATYVEVGTVTAPPANSMGVKLNDYLIAIGKLPWYRTTWGMGLIAAGGLTAAVGAFLLLSRKAK